MNYSEPGIEISLTANTLTFSGTLEKSDYADVDTFLRQVDQNVSEHTCVIELKKLSFLNSSGIRSLATFMLGSPKTFKIHINNDITWQRESIPPLACLKPDDIKIVT